MEVVRKGWVRDFECSHCETVVRLRSGDVRFKQKFKFNGYDNIKDGMKYFVECPECKKEIEIPRSEAPPRVIDQAESDW